jgi:hypothetical protein
MPTPETPDTPYAATPSTADFGPDHTAAADVPMEPPKINGKNAPRPTKSTRKGFKLGQNVSRGSGIRQLTQDDKAKISALYVYGSMGLMPFKPEAASAMANAADACAEAWLELSKKNDAVRRVLVALVEGGAWGKVFAAHTPIILTLLPKNAIPALFNVDIPDSPEDLNGQ